MTGVLFLLALIDFWTGFILCILSGLGKISAPIWLILLITAGILAILIIMIHLTSVREYGEDYDISSQEDKDQIEALRKMKNQKY